MTWAAVGVGTATLAGAALSSDAASRASNAQGAAADRSITAQNTQNSLTRVDNAPFLKSGTAANQRLAMLLGLNGASGIAKPTMEDAAAEHLKWHIGKYGVGYTKDSDMHAKDVQTQEIFDRMMQDYNTQVANAPVDPQSGSLLRKFTADDLNADPVYKSGLQFGLDQGRDAINARATMAGGYDSGATLKALTRFGTDYGSTKANESYNRFTNDQNNTFNRLSGISGTGQVATGQVAAAGTNAANNISGSLDAAGNARAAGIVGGANAWGNAATGLNSAYNNYNNNQILQQLLKRNGTTGSTQPVYGDE